MAVKLEELKEFLKKNRYVALVLLCGVVLMCLPQRQKTNTAPMQTEPSAEQADLEQRLEIILAQVSGTGAVRVLLTRDSSGETVYQTDSTEDSDAASQSSRTQTVLLSDGSRQETGLVRQRQEPVYRGAVVVCQGAGAPAVKLAVVEAVAAATGLPTNRITVLKMK